MRYFKKSNVSFPVCHSADEIRMQLNSEHSILNYQQPEKSIICLVPHLNFFIDW